MRNVRWPSGPCLARRAQGRVVRRSWARAHALLKVDGDLQASQPQRLAWLRELGVGR